MALLARSHDILDQAVARAARPDYPDWLTHVRAAAGCTRPVRLAGAITTVENGTGRLLSTMDTGSMPDGVIYKPCGNRRDSVCPSCSARYKRDAYQIVRAGLVGGDGVPEDVATHPAVFPTFTAPSFGEVHTRVVKRHTCGRRATCDCRPEPCHARRDLTVCPHGARLVCWARHDQNDRQLGTPMCLDCYDHTAQVVWNIQAGELWRRTTEAIRKYIKRIARRRGIDPATVRLAIGKAAEMQRRAVIHFHAIIRLDGADPDDPDAILDPPRGIDAKDLVAAVDHAAKVTSFTTEPHPAHPDGWRIGWGDQVHTKIITVAAEGDVTDAQVAAYIAKYATKSTEITGHTSARITLDNVTIYGSVTGTHTERLVMACWTLGRAHHGNYPDAYAVQLLQGPACRDTCRHRTCADIRDPVRRWRRLRRWAHMLGYGGHFLTKSRTYSVTFAVKRQQRVTFRRTATSGPDTDAAQQQEPAPLVLNFLQYVGSGWQTPADAMLATASAAMAREHQQAAAEYLGTLAA